MSPTYHCSPERNAPKGMEPLTTQQNLEIIGNHYANILLRSHDLKKAAESAITAMKKTQDAITKGQADWPYLKRLHLEVSEMLAGALAAMPDVSGRIPGIDQKLVQSETKTGGNGTEPGKSGTIRVDDSFRKAGQYSFSEIKVFAQELAAELDRARLAAESSPESAGIREQYRQSVLMARDFLSHAIPGAIQNETMAADALDHERVVPFDELRESLVYTFTKPNEPQSILSTIENAEILLEDLIRHVKALAVVTERGIEPYRAFHYRWRVDNSKTAILSEFAKLIVSATKIPGKMVE